MGPQFWETTSFYTILHWQIFLQWDHTVTRCDTRNTCSTKIMVARSSGSSSDKERLKGLQPMPRSWSGPRNRGETVEKPWRNLGKIGNSTRNRGNQRHHVGFHRVTRKILCHESSYLPIRCLVGISECIRYNVPLAVIFGWFPKKHNNV